LIFRVKDSFWSIAVGTVLQKAAGEFVVAGSGFLIKFENTNKELAANIAFTDGVISKVYK
jgi:hypothetical protein